MTINGFFKIVAMLVLAACTSVAFGESARSYPVSGTILSEQVHIGSRYGGRVTKVHAAEGDKVTTGQVLIELEAPELLAKRDYAAAVLAELTKGTRSEEIAAARDERDALQKELDNAKSDEKRVRDLYRQHGATASERDRAATRVQSLEKSVAAARKRLDLLIAGPTPERISQARAQVAEVEAQVRELSVISPAESQVEILNVRPGDLAAPGHELATLSFSNDLSVRVYVPQPWLARVAPGREFTVTSDAVPGRRFLGKVEHVNQTAEFTPRNVQTSDERLRQVFGVKLRILNAAGILRPGMSVDVLIPPSGSNP